MLRGFLARFVARTTDMTFEKAGATSSRAGVNRRCGFETLEPRLVLDSTLVFNEIMYNPGGAEDATLEWVELYNQLAVDLDISEWALEGGIDFQFPDGTVVAGRDYLVVAINPEALETSSGYAGAIGPYEGMLSNGGEELRLVNNSDRVMNVIEFGDDEAWPAGPDGGGVSLAKLDPATASDSVENWSFSLEVGGTPGTVNFPNALPQTYPIALSEVTPASADVFWLEIVNLGTETVNLGGVELVVTGTGGGQYTFPSQTVSSGGYVQVTGIKLGFHPHEGEKLFLYTPGQDRLLDARVVTNQLRGRCEELGGTWLYPDLATPAGANSFELHDEIVINEIMYHSFPDLRTPDTPATYESIALVTIDEETLWRYNPTGDDLPSNWAQASHTVDGVDWFEGPALIGYDTNPGAVAGTLRTQLDAPRSNDPYIITYYFEIDFEIDGDLSEIERLEVRHVIDDGAIFYLNGVELDELRFGMDPGPVTADTTASLTVGDADSTGPISIPTDNLHVGTNRLSVEVHQTDTNSSDIVFGTELLAWRQVSDPIPGEPYQESNEEWIELYNRSATAVDLSGWRIADAVDYEFPAGTILSPHEYLVVARDAASLQGEYPAIDIVGDFSRSLSNGEDRILLVDSAGNPADEVHYYDSGRWPQYADGGGSSLELRNPDADNSRAEAWAPSDESAKSTWQTYTYRAVCSEPLLVGTNLQQFILGLLDEGEFLLDNVSVRRDPDGVNREVITNGSFENDPVGSRPSGWRLVGNHSGGTVQLDGDNKVLHFIATGPQQHIHDHVTADFGNGESIQDGKEYEISLDAKWIAGCAQVNNRFYFTRMSNTFLLDVPENNGTPGARNSTFEANVGPTYSDLVQNPILPAAGEAVTISVRAEDPDGIQQVELRSSVNEGAFSTWTMILDEDGLYRATIPGQSSGSTVQFYVRGWDTQGGLSTFPAAGQDSRALYYVGAGSATNKPIDTVRIIMLDSDLDDLSVRYNEMSNMYFGCSIVHTIHYDTGPVDVAYHDVEIRQVGSRWIRPNSGYKIRLHPDQKFYGVHESIRLDINYPSEIYMKHMVNRAGASSVSLYDDVAVMVDPLHGTCTILLQLARYEDTYLTEQFVNGTEGTKWELDDIVLPTSPVPLGYNGDEVIMDQDIFYRGPDPEFYRGHLLIKNQRYKDNYQAIVDLAWAMNRTDQQELYEATNAVMDVDLWMRHYATQSFLGNWDSYGFSRPKNLRIYVRPEDGKMIPLYWDADLANLSDPFIWNGAYSRLDDIRNIPQNLRLFWGHMWDLTNRSFNGTYMAPWLSYYSQLVAGLPSASDINNRAIAAQNEARAAIPKVRFHITTNDGNDFSVDQSGTTLEGRGWIDVRTIRIAGTEEPLEVTWTGVDTWQVYVPLAPGANEITLQALDFEASLTGYDTVTITSTVSEHPLQDYLRITELNYHPADPTLEEQQAGYTDAENFEFLELFNTGPVTLDLAGVQFLEGIDFTFPGTTYLDPGAFLVLASNPDAVQARYGSEIGVVGQYDGQLKNSGEQVILADLFGQVILDFTYGDSGEPGWPDRADGMGSSLEVLDVQGDYSNASNWRASSELGGTPGSPGEGPRYDVLINEVLAHSDAPAVDVIELYNGSGASVDLSGWWLSDSATDLFKYQFGPGSSIAAGSYLCLDENDFNPGGGTNATDFALSAGGDDLWLIEADSEGQPIRFADVVFFDATLSNVTLGRIPNGSADHELFPLAASSLGMVNGSHRLGDLVISEINYHPDAPLPGSTITEEQLEFVELFNRSAVPVVLNDHTLGGWRLRGGADFDFNTLPLGTALADGDVLVLVSFDPSNGTLAGEFRAHYGIDGNVVLVGPYSGNLDDDGTQVRLLAPTEPPLGEVDPVHYLVDRVTYDVVAPWPTEPNGTGNSLHRIAAESFGEFAISWQASAPTPGNVAFAQTPSGDFNGDGDVDRSDLGLWEDGFGTTTGAILSTGDSDADGDVDGFDFLVWQRDFGGEMASGTASSDVQTPANEDSATAGELDIPQFRLPNAVRPAQKTQAVEAPLSRMDHRAPRVELKQPHDNVVDVALVHITSADGEPWIRGPSGKMSLPRATKRSITSDDRVNLETALDELIEELLRLRLEKT